jgi:methyltransferase (TIGR00027 family)
MARGGAQVTCRSRYAEDRLAGGVRRGIGQYVILGAGLDSFAGRSELAGQVRVFEVDHPATQDYKRRVLPDTGNVAFVPVDFSRDSFGEGLRRAGFDVAAPAFVSWLGVTMYLAESAIEATLSAVGGFAPGSQIVVDYMLPAGWRDAAGDSYADLVGQASAEWGEPWRSLLAPAAMAALLGRHGLQLVRDISQRDMIPATAWHRSDSLRPVELSRLVHAAVPGRRAQPRFAVAATEAATEGASVSAELKGLG